MTRDEILNSIHHKENNLYFHFDKGEQELFIKRFESNIHKLNMIKNFDFNKYQKYLGPSFDELLEISFDRLRDDEIVHHNNPHSLFVNSVEFKEGYVVIKNEK